MITQDEMEAALETRLLGATAVQSVLLRFLAGEPVEPGFFNVASLVQIDREANAALMRACIKAARRAVFICYQNELPETWTRHWEAQWEYLWVSFQIWKLEMAMFLMRCHIVDVIDTAAARQRISEYLRKCASDVPPAAS